MKVAVCFLLVAIVAVYAKKPVKPCVSPRTFECNLVQYDSQKPYMVMGKFSYDDFNQQMRVVEQVDFNKTRDYFDVLFLHRERRMYVLNLKTRKCTRQPMVRPWRREEIPRDAKFLGLLYLGSSAAAKEGLLVQTWHGNFSDPEVGKGIYYGVWTETDCLPVSSTLVTKKVGVIQSSYFDVTMGIANPNVFIPPAECFRQGQVPLGYRRTGYRRFSRRL